MCMVMCIGRQVSAEARGVRYLEMQFQATLSLLAWVLGIKLESSRRVVVCVCGVHIYAYIISVYT